MCGLPDTYKEFIKRLQESKDSFDQSEEIFYDLSEAFEACYECAICGTRIIDEYLLAENIAEHYEVEDKTDEILKKIWESGIETGGGADEVLCSYCAYVHDKDEWIVFVASLINQFYHAQRG